MSEALANPTGNLEAERLSLERERLKLERQKLAIEVRLKKRELVKNKDSLLKELLANPLALAIVGGIITLLTSVATTSYTANENRKSEEWRAVVAQNTAKQALQAELIKKFVEAPKTETVRENLKFLVDSGLLPDYREGIEKYLKENPNKAPTLGNAAVTDLKFEAQAPYLMRRLISDFDLKDFQAAAIVGNIAFETAGFAAVQERSPLGGGRGGFGYLLWTGSRRASFEQYVKDNKLDPATIEANYASLNMSWKRLCKMRLKR